MNDIKLKLKKVNGRYFIGGGKPVNWNPLPANLKNRTEVNQYFKTGNNPQQLLEYSTDAGQPARFYEVTWWKNAYTNTMMPRISEDEDKFLIMEKPFASDEEITAFLKERAKGEGKEAEIHFIEARPEQPKDD